MAALKQFIVAAVPRSGSTFLIQHLARAVDAYVPDVNHRELFNPYEKLFNCHVLRLDGSSEVCILDEFFRRSNRPYAGLKTIPGFHREWSDIAGRQDIQFITLLRKDFLSCAASYIVSDRRFQWEKPSREQLDGRKLVFGDLYATEAKKAVSLGATLGYLLFNYRAIERLNARPDTICLATEDLVQSEPVDSRLREFLGCPITFDGFRAPTHYTECFEDHFYFKVNIVRMLRSLLEFDSQVPQPIQAVCGGA